MYFCVISLYYKHVVDIIYKHTIKMRKNNIIDEANEDVLFESYLKLEKLLRDDFI